MTLPAEQNQKVKTAIQNLLSKQIATIQVKTEDRKETYVLKLSEMSTVGKIYAMIDKHRGIESNEIRTYELRGGFPPQVYDDYNSTLVEAGLVPNASLFIRKVAYE